MSPALPSRVLWVAVGFLLGLAALVGACGGEKGAPLQEGDAAPPFAMHAVDGSTVSLSDYSGQKGVLLYFSMGYGWEPCQQQVVDLERDERFKSLDVQLVSIALDSPAELAQDVARLGIQSPYVSDEDHKVVEAYGLPLAHGGEPGHIFVLVSKDGTIKWIRDYSAETMYVAPDELYTELSQRL